MASFKIFVIVLVTIVSVSGIPDTRVYEELSKCTNDDRAACILYYQLIQKKCNNEGNNKFCVKENEYRKECDDFGKTTHCFIYKCAKSESTNGHCVVQFMWQHQTETIAFFVCLAVITIGCVFWCCKRGCGGCCKRKSGVTLQSRA